MATETTRATSTNPAHSTDFDDWHPAQQEVTRRYLAGEFKDSQEEYRARVEAAAKPRRWVPTEQDAMSGIDCNPTGDEHPNGAATHDTYAMDTVRDEVEALRDMLNDGMLVFRVDNVIECLDSVLRRIDRLAAS